MSKKTKPNPIKHKIFISYSESREGGDVIDPENSWPSYEPTYIDVSFNGYKSEHVNDFTSPWLDSFDVTDEVFALVKTGVDLHLVVARYSDGDTFGSTNGYWKISRLTAMKPIVLRRFLMIQTERLFRLSATWKPTTTGVTTTLVVGNVPKFVPFVVLTEVRFRYDGDLRMLPQVRYGFS